MATVAEAIIAFRGDSAGAEKASKAVRDSLAQTGAEAKKAAGAFSGDLAKGGNTASTALGEMRSAAEKASTTLQGAGVQTGALGQVLTALKNPITLVVGAFAAAAAAAVAATRAFADNGIEVRALMAVSGLGAEAADNLSNTFALLGHESGTLQAALFKMGSEIDSGGAALQRLGISLVDSQGHMKAEGDLLLEVRDRISGMGSASQRSAALMDLFGRAGKDLAATFALSSEEFAKYKQRAEQLSPWNAQLQREATLYTLAVTELGMAWDGLTIRIGAAVTPIFTAIAKLTSEAVLFASSTIDALDRVGAATEVFGVRIISALSVTLTGMGVALGAMLGGPLGAAIGAAAGLALGTLVTSLRDAGELAKAEADKLARGLQVPIKIQLEMEKAAIDERLRQRVAYVDLVLDAEKQGVAAGLIEQSRALQTELAGLAERRAAQEEWYQRQAKLLKTSGDQFGQAMDGLTLKHKAATDALYRQSETVRRALDSAKISESIDKIEKSFKSAADAERKYADAFTHDLPVMTEDAKRHVRVLDEIGQSHRRFATEAQLAATKEMQAKTATLATINGAAQESAIAHARYEQQKTQASGNFFGFLTASVQEQMALQPTVWDSIQGATVGAFNSAQQAASDFLFNFITGTATAAETFAQFGKALLRTITDFLAQQAVKTFLSILFGGSAKGFSEGGIVGGGAGGGGGAGLSSLFGGGSGTDVIPALLSKGEMVLSSDTVQKMLKGDFSGLVDTLTGTGSSLTGSVSQALANATTNFNLAGGGAAGVEAALFGMNATNLNTAIAAQQGAEFATANLGAAGSAGLLGSGGLSTGASTLTGGNAALLGAGLALALATNDSSTPQGQASNAAAIASTTAAAAAMLAGVSAGAATGVGALVALPLVLGALFGQGGPFGSKGRRPDADLLSEMGITMLGQSIVSGVTPKLSDVTSASSVEAMARVLGTDAATLTATALNASTGAGASRTANWLTTGDNIATRVIEPVANPLAQLFNPGNIPSYDPLGAWSPIPDMSMADFIRWRTMNPATFDPESNTYVSPESLFRFGIPSFHRGGIARVEDGEVMTPRPFAQEFPALSRALERREFSGGRRPTSLTIVAHYPSSMRGGTVELSVKDLEKTLRKADKSGAKIIPDTLAYKVHRG